MNDDEFLARFERLEISGRDFHHAEHVRLAWSCLRGASLAAGAARFLDGFRRFADHIGAQSKYHETISWFYLVAAKERLATQPPAPWPEFARQNADLLDPSMAILKGHYPPAVLASPRARQTFLLPRPQSAAEGRGTPG